MTVGGITDWRFVFWRLSPNPTTRWRAWLNARSLLETVEASVYRGINELFLEIILPPVALVRLPSPEERRNIP